VKEDIGQLHHVRIIGLIARHLRNAPFALDAHGSSRIANAGALLEPALQCRRRKIAIQTARPFPASLAPVDLINQESHSRCSCTGFCNSLLMRYEGARDEEKSQNNHESSAGHKTSARSSP